MCIYLGLYWIIGAAVVAAVVVDGNSRTGWDRYLAVVPTYSAIMCCRSLREVRRGLGVGGLGGHRGLDRGVYAGQAGRWVVSAYLGR